mgnify:FL=1
MARYDAWPDGDGWLLEVQADLLRDLNTRVVVPLMPPARAPHPARQLNPVLDVAGAPQVMVTQFLSAVSLGLLEGTPVSLTNQSAAISNALDLLLTGV